MELKIKYLLQIADNAMIIGHRLSEWCGHGPILEQDIAMTNIALDHLGLARNLYQYCARLEGGGKTEDDYPYKRDVRKWRNLLLCEQDNGDFGKTITRQFLYDTFNLQFLTALQDSHDEHLAAIAAKSLKETTYHLQYSGDWMIRLGDGTEESHDRIQKSVNDLWMYADESFLESEADRWALNEKIGVDLNALKLPTQNNRTEILKEATLQIPESGWTQQGGKEGKHSEQLGYILSDLQFLQRAYPNSVW